MRLTPRALPLALVVAVAVAGVVYLGGMRRTPTFEAVQLWTWTTAPPGEAAPYLEALSGSELRAEVAAAWLGRAPQPGEVDAVERWLAARADPAGIRIVVRGATAEEVEGRSAAVAAAFAAWSIDHLVDRRESKLAAAQTRVEAATERVRAAQVLGQASEGDVAELLRERDAAVDARDAALTALATGPTAPLEARPDVVRTRPSTAARDALVSGALAGALGLLAGLRGSAGTAAAAKRRAQRSPSQRVASEGGRTWDAPASSVADALARFPAATGDDVPALRSPAEVLARAVVAHDAPAPAVVLVVSVAPGEGKTTVACHLAEALARSGHRTLLVDASLWSPALAARYDLVEAPTAAASRIASTLDWMQRPQGSHQVVGVDLGDERRLDLVPQFRATRPAPGTAAALFGAFGDALGRWRGYDVVVVDTAALDAVDDTTHLAPFATTAVVVVDRRLDARRHRDDARRRLRGADVPILGFVLNEPRRPAEAIRGSAAVG
ncbi:MAG: tyrosine-protein kinase family protein [Trueperaceae bacterium]